MTRWTLTVIIVSMARIALATEPDELRVAVVVGNNVGLPEDEPLRYAEEDAGRVFNLLTRVGGVDPDRAYLLLDQPAQELLRILAVVAGRIQELAGRGPVSLLLYVSSHADRDGLHLSGTRLNYSELRRSLSAMATEFRLIIVDACQTAVRSRDKGGGTTEPIEVRLTSTPRTEGEVFITSASDGEPAQEWSYLRGALFTHHLISGLRGAADYDGNNVISLFEAYSYAYRNTTVEAARGSQAPQTPTYDFQLRGFGDWPFARPAAFGASVELAEELTGRYWIADRGNRLASEVSKAAGYVLRVHLEPGWYRVASPRGAYVDATDLNLSWGGTRRLGPDDFVRVPNRPSTLRGARPVVLRPLQLQGDIGVSRGTVDGLATTPVLGLGLRYGWGPWFGRVRVLGSVGDFTAGRLDVSHREFRFGAALGRTRFLFAGTEGALGIEGEAGWIRQRSRREEPAAIPSAERDRSTDGALVSASVLLALSLPLDDRWVLRFESNAGVSWVPVVGASLEARALIRGSLAVAWRM